MRIVDEMGMKALSELMKFVSGDGLYFYFDASISDFTKQFTGKMYVSCDAESKVFLAEELGFKYNLSSFHTCLCEIIKSKKLVLTWGIKDLVSYLSKRLKKVDLPISKFIDLKYSLSYQGKKRNDPFVSFVEASEWLKQHIDDKGWKLAKNYIYDSLSISTLPIIETKGIVDIRTNKLFFTHYDIEGQANGRLQARRPSDRFLNIHNLSPEDKEYLVPPYALDEELYFVVLDYRSMEVSVLAWLAQDDVLSSAIQSTNFYESLITWDTNGANKHKIGKLIFLPLVYGMTSKSLSERLKLSKQSSDQLVNDIKSKFKKSFDWVGLKENEFQNEDYAIDRFFRVRSFKDEPKYKIRNFLVQSPASFICLKKLCELTKVLSNSMQFHIHDGYVLVCNKKNISEVIRTAKNVLESEMEICQGLKLRVGCQVGKSLNHLKSINI